MIGDPELIQQLSSPPVGVARGHPGKLCGNKDVVAHGQVVEQVEELEDEADFAAPVARQRGLGKARDILAVDPDRAVGRAVESRHEVEQRRLPAA